MVDFIGPMMVDPYKIDKSEIDHDQNQQFWDPQMV